MTTVKARFAIYENAPKKGGLWVQIVNACWQFTAKHKYRNMEAVVSLVGWRQTVHSSFHVPVITPRLSYSNNVQFFILPRDQNYMVLLQTRG
jgi:hypothetical protein